MKQLYYIIRTLTRSKNSNIIKIISLTLGMTISIILFARVAFELVVWGVILICVVIKSWRVANEDPVVSIKSE